MAQQSWHSRGKFLVKQNGLQIKKVEDHDSKTQQQPNCGCLMLSYCRRLNLSKIIDFVYVQNS